jgi:hypothetical protein
MYQILQATYQDGKLILEEELNATLAGKRLQILVMPATEDLETQKAQFFDRLRTHSVKLPEGYQFNREDLYDR